jgi:hypothetical protein
MSKIISIVACVVILFVLVGCCSNRIKVSNTGIDQIEILTEGTEKKMILGEGGTGYFDLDSKIQIGDVFISIGDAHN